MGRGAHLHLRPTAPHGSATSQRDSSGARTRCATPAISMRPVRQQNTDSLRGSIGKLDGWQCLCPLNPQMPSDRLRDILCASDIDTIIVDYRSTAAAMPLLKGLPWSLTVLLPDAVTTEEWPPGHRY